MVGGVRVRGRRVRVAHDAPAHRRRTFHRRGQFRRHHRRAAFRGLRRGGRTRRADDAHADVQAGREAVGVFRRDGDLGVAGAAAEDAQRGSGERCRRHLGVRRCGRVRQRVALRFAEQAGDVEFRLAADFQQDDLRLRDDLRGAVAGGASGARRGACRGRRVAGVAAVQAEDADFVDPRLRAGRRCGRTARRWRRGAFRRRMPRRRLGLRAGGRGSIRRRPRAIAPSSPARRGMRTSSPPGWSCRPRTPARGRGPGRRRRRRPARRTPPSRWRSRRRSPCGAAALPPWRRRRPFRRAP